MDKIGIVVAMEGEKDAVKNLMKDIELEESYELDFHKGKIENKKCILVQSGVGKVNAARTTQILIDKYKVNKVINVGAAASIDTIGKKVVQHDFDITAFGHSKGYITGVGNDVSCDSDWLDKIKDVVNEKRDYKVRTGIVATGDIFCTGVKLRDEIRATFKADVVDMECGAIAQVCYLDNIPFLVIRGVSDTPNGENEKDFDKNLELASNRCAEILKEVLHKM